MRILILTTLLIAAIFVSGCNPQATTEPTTQEEETQKKEEKQKKEQKQKKEEKQEKDEATFEMGEPAVLSPSEGWVIVESYESNVQSPNRDVNPEPGNEFALVDVSYCAGEKQTGDISPSYFFLQMPDSTRRKQTSKPGLEPRLFSRKPALEECVRGNVLFEIPQGEKPPYVIFSPPFHFEGKEPRWIVE